MPRLLLPTWLPTEVASHNSQQSCYVTIGSRVYDITEFLNRHPGGGDRILEYGGHDVSKIMEHEPSHKHSKVAYEILGKYLIGNYLVTKMFEKPCEKPDGRSWSALPPVYRETSIDSQADPLTFIKPRTGLLEDKRLALGQRKIAGSGQAYYLDPLRFMHTKSKVSVRVESASHPTYGDAHYLEEMQNSVKPPSNPLSDRRLWYRVILRVSYSLKASWEILAWAMSFIFLPYTIALILLVAALGYDIWKSIIP